MNPLRIVTGVLSLLALPYWVAAQHVPDSLVTPFERSAGRATATYEEVCSFYQTIGHMRGFTVESMGQSDGGTDMLVVKYKSPLYPGGKTPVSILFNNGIHPGEPDGVDACMLLLRDIAIGKIDVPENVSLAVVALYNVDGALNRSCCSRANQDGPEAYGFRGNSHNLDLNRDFIKCDAAETRNLERLFRQTDPDIFVDNHVSDGADYQHVMTLLTSQHDKAGGAVGDYSYSKLTPMIFEQMKKRGYDLVPYVNDFSSTPDHGWREFYEPPRFSSGYAALFQCFAFVPETHMLKPFKQRVKATYDLALTFMELAGSHADEIYAARSTDRRNLAEQQEFPLEWQADTTRCDSVLFRGYTSGYKASQVSGLPRLYYDHDKPFEKKVPFFDHYQSVKKVKAPLAYVIPAGWGHLRDILRLQGVTMTVLNRDSTIAVTAYRITNYESASKPYEGHYLHKNVTIEPYCTRIVCHRGDCIVNMEQPAKRYLVETLEPTGPDAFFAWNYFDGMLQQKEYFSDYVFEDAGAAILAKDPSLQTRLNDKKAHDPVFAASAEAQLDFVYRNSGYMEPGYMRYPIFRIE
jgi:Zinc carboxypeptidase